MVGGGLLIASLTSAVGRSEDGRRLSQELDRLEADELIMRDRVAAQTARADSLAALPRMEDAAREIGLRRAEDGEVFHLSDPSAARVDGAEVLGVGRVDGGR